MFKSFFSDVFNQFLHQSGQGVMAQLALLNPYIALRQGGAGAGLEQIEVGQDNAVGEHMPHLSAQKGETAAESRHLGALNEQRLPQPLPDIVPGAAADGGLILIPYIYKGHVPLLHLLRLELHGQLVYAPGAQRLAALNKRTRCASW